MNVDSIDPDDYLCDPARDRRATFDAGAGVRQAGLLFAAVGALGLVTDIVPGTFGQGHLVRMLLDVVVLGAGITTVLLHKTHFLQGRAGGLTLAVFAMVCVAANNVAGTLPPAAYGSYFTLIMVWVGIWYPPGTAVALSPVMACAYLVPLFLGAPRSPGVVPAVILVVPIAVLAGETIAHYTGKIRRGVAARERLLSELSRENVTDELTGVGNRRLGEILLDSLEPGDAVAILDVDLFKQVNDTYGHPEGDRLLQQLGSHLSTAMRGRDAVARMGGDEFMVVMRGAGPEGINTVSRLVRSWRKGAPPATISAGVAVHKRRTNPKATYAAADGALYEAKQTGHDRALLAGMTRIAA